MQGGRVMGLQGLAIIVALGSFAFSAQPLLADQAAPVAQSAPADQTTPATQAAPATQADPFLGTWVLDPSKVDAAAASPLKGETIKLSDLGNGVWKSVTDQVTAAGTTLHSEVAFSFDGKDYMPVTTPAMPDGAPQFTESFKRLAPDTIRIALKLDGKSAGSLINKLSPDGQTLTLSGTGSADDEPMLIGVFARK
jgi:hypothetical protein